MNELEQYIEHLKKEVKVAKEKTSSAIGVCEISMAHDNLLDAREKLKSAEEFNNQLKRPFMGSNAG